MAKQRVFAQFFLTFRIFKKLNIFWGMELLASEQLYSEHEILVWFRKPPEIRSFCQFEVFVRNILSSCCKSTFSWSSQKSQMGRLSDYPGHVVRVKPRVFENLGPKWPSFVSNRLKKCVRPVFFTENKQLLGTRVQQKSLVAGQIYNLSRGKVKPLV